MIVVLDTNVLVAGLLKPYGPSASVLRLILGGMARIAFDYRILAEYRDVLTRPAFGFARLSVDAVLSALEADGVPVAPPPLPGACSDPDDIPFWEAAVAARADALITGNKRHFPARRSVPRIVSPAEFLDLYRVER